MNAVLSPAWTKAPPLVIDLHKESLRLEELRALKLDSLPEERFDRITRLAAKFFGVAAAYIAFIDEHRQWLKSTAGFCEKETPRNMSFCQYTIQLNEPLVIPDTTIHPIGRNHPAVIGEPHIRFYTGVPLSGPTGQKIGSFCLVDTKPREFSQDSINSLLGFAALVEREINLSEIIQSQNELLQTRHQLVEAQKKLTQEFSEAAKYVQQMLPPPFSGQETLDWQFHPSTHLGGDGLGYRRIDEDRLAFYMLDVTGHGLGSALLAVTALELLRNRNPASQLDFGSPPMVIDRLNRSFQMKDHAGKFFSVWYGVYSRSARTITYSNAGHPPPLLLTTENGISRIEKTGPGSSVLGVTPVMGIPEIIIPFTPKSELFLFTDGLYELFDGKGGHGSYDEFLAWLEKEIASGRAAWPSILDWFDQARLRKLIDDDVSLLRFTTRE